MNRLLRFFFPRELDFFSPMSRMFDLIERGAEIYMEAAGKGELSQSDREKLLTSLKDLEVSGDDIVRQITVDLKRTFTPPFSQVELRRLFECLDNMVDRLDETVKILVHAGYRDDFPPFVLDQLKVFQRGVMEGAKCVELLKDPRKNAQGLNTVLSRMSDIESEGDKIYWPTKIKLSAAINSAARNNRLLDYRVATMDEIMLDRMEELIDTLVEIMKVMEGMIIEHA